MFLAVKPLLDGEDRLGVGRLYERRRSASPDAGRNVV
jgi:hypothetical protein